MYGVAIAARNRKYDRGIGVVRLRTPVVSVGNVSVGGTGKSPTVRWIAELLQRENVKPVIAMRGYKAKSGEKSDEQLEHEELLAGVDVLAQPNRVAALQPYLKSHADIGCVILDDGFQHRKIARDLDIVLVDAQQPMLDARVLPVGRLREPMQNLRRADAVFVTRAEQIDAALARRIESLHGKPPTAWLNHSWKRFRVYSKSSNGSSFEAMSWLRGKRVVTLAGIANPDAFVKQVESSGATVAARFPARDHQHYTAPGVARLASEAAQADALVTTFKDWVKIRRVIDLSQWTTPIVVPEVAIVAVEGEDRVIEMLRRIIQAGPTQSRPA